MGGLEEVLGMRPSLQRSRVGAWTRWFIALLSTLMLGVMGATVVAVSPAAAALSVQLVSQSQWGPDSAGLRHIVGEVVNNGDTLATFVQINFNYFNASGTL